MTKTVGNMGGTVNTGDGSGVNIPQGALPTQAMITITSIDAPAPAGTVLVGPAYDFQPDGTTFAQPVTITLPFDASKIPSGRTTADIHIYTAPRGSTSYTPLTTTVSGATVSTQTSHFTVYLAAVPLPGSGGGDLATPADLAMPSGEIDFATSTSCSPTCMLTSSPMGCGCTETCNGHVYTMTCTQETTTSPVSCFCEIDGQTQSTQPQLTMCSVSLAQSAFVQCTPN